ncbi:MlaD family protein [Nocardia bovistercoris]|uniref:MCE family protein n=1 Tax=Nocardia bovistercoris TaxID=2785916 RepID=A0A931I613_9NOCA|nr:MlaD family protein [Nocardia bovistercoris]MBH0775514.1 MCE family protein [Nocardia bovistercoris]
MPAYGMPGVHIDRPRARVIGVAAMLVIVLVCALVGVHRMLAQSHVVSIVLYTENIGDGIAEGTDVRLDGVGVGEVAAIDPAPLGRQRIELHVDENRLANLDESMRVDYAPANLFGISVIELRRGAGGPALRPGSEIHLTGDRSGDVYDATLGELLRSLSRTSVAVATPQLSQLIGRLATDLRAFTPFMQAVIQFARTVADHQRMPPSEVLGSFGESLGASAGLVDATVSVIARINGIDVLRTDRPRIDAGIGLVVDTLFPALTTMLSSLDGTFAGYTNMLAPLLNVLAQSVPTPTRSGAELGELIGRVDAAMPDSGSGPVLNVDVDLSGVPAVAVPLLGGRTAGAVR